MLKLSFGWAKWSRWWSDLDIFVPSDHWPKRSEACNCNTALASWKDPQLSHSKCGSKKEVYFTIPRKSTTPKYKKLHVLGSVANGLDDLNFKEIEGLSVGRTYARPCRPPLIDSDWNFRFAMNFFEVGSRLSKLSLSWIRIVFVIKRQLKYSPVLPASLWWITRGPWRRTGSRSFDSVP